MKITLAQLNFEIGNFKKNTAKIIDAIHNAKSQHTDLIVFSELSVCGYPPADMLNYAGFLSACESAINEIKEHADEIGVLIGAPAHNKGLQGKNLFNAAYLLHNKEIIGQINKTLLPTYDIFDEYRYFEPAKSWEVLSFKGKKLAITICEDIWNLIDDPLYILNPLDELVKHQPDVIINLSASPFDYTKVEDRKAVIKTNVLKYKLPLIYCNAVGAQGEIIFDGGSVVFDKNANLVQQLPLFEEGVGMVHLNDDKDFEEDIITAVEEITDVQLNPSELVPDLNIEWIHKALVEGIKDYFLKLGFKKAIIGSSGGVDSAVTLALACEALGSDNVTAVLMPSPYSTSHSVDDAVALSKNLNNPYHIFHIKDMYESFLKTLDPLFKGLPFNVAEENLQARIRGNLIMALANKFGYILLNTSNKSELATGYGTLYGDMAGGLAILGDCYKLQIYELVKYINRNKEIIPNHIITKPPSAELRPDQKDQDSLPPYEILDKVLYQYIDLEMDAAQIKSLGFDALITDRILHLVNKNEYKRRQFCPIIRISSKAFGMGRRMPLVATYLV